MTLTLHTDRRLIRAQASSVRYLLASIIAPDAPRRAERLAVNTALILDRSGSMAGSRKFELAREAVEQALRMLRPEDRFSLVVYDTEVDVLAPSAAATNEAKRRALDLLRDVGPRGGTDLCAGWLRGCEQVAGHLSDEGISRVLLLTDGLANHGTTDPGALTRHAAELRQRGIATSTFGVGEDFDERLLRDMAHEGGGNFYFIESPVQIPDFLASEIGEALEVVLRRAALHVVLPPGAGAEPLNRFRHTFARGDNELRVELGDLVSGQETDVVVRVRFPQAEVGARATVRVVLSSADALEPHAEGSVEWTYAGHSENDRQERDVRVDREVARLYAARARAEATEANRVGDFDRARQVLEGTAKRVSQYAGTDREMREIVRSIREEMPRYAETAMSPLMLKQGLYYADAASRGRDHMGRAKRRRPE